MKVSNQHIFFNSSENMKEIDDGCIDFIITSPPYWNLKDYGSASQIGQSSYEDYLLRLDSVWAECYRVARFGAVMVVNINSRRVNKRFIPIPFDIALRMQNWNFWDHVIWYIPNALPQPNHYMERLLDNKFESCLVFIKGSADSYVCHKPRVPQKYAFDARINKINPKGRCLGNILRIPAYRPPNVKEAGYHAAAYPEELVAFFIETYSDPCSHILDPFLGSGTTLKVARIMERNGFGYEINPDYRELIKARILENWEVPQWADLDVIHSSTMMTGVQKQRKAQFKKGVRK